MILFTMLGLVAVATLTVAQSNVLVIYTGGTIGMINSERGELVPGAKGDFTKTLDDIFKSPETDGVKLDTIEIEPLYDSCNMGHKEWNTIATYIHADNTHDAFVVVHGTDTLCYTGSALTFMLPTLNRPVVLTGSQIPISDINSDGPANLRGAVSSCSALLKSNGAGVFIFFGGRLMRAVTVTKQSASNLDAFTSDNTAPIGTITSQRNRHTAAHLHLHTSRLKHTPILTLPDRVLPMTNSNVAILQLWPDMPIKVVDAVLRSTKSLLLLTYGAGNAPTNRPELLSLLAKYANEESYLLVHLSQVRHRAAAESDYATGGILKDHGVVHATEMTIESCYAKMRFLMNSNTPIQFRRQAMVCNMFGELPSQTLEQDSRCQALLG